MRLLYITARLPYGDGETFIVPEIEALVAEGCHVAVVPVRAGGDIVHADARELFVRTVAAPLFSPAVLGTALAEVARAPIRVARVLSLLLRGTSLRVLAKNLAVFPKALWVARLARKSGTDHVHAHWAGTSATLAMVAAEVAGIPWSLTAHRWDIPEDNLLAQKVRRACFVRAISEHGAAELRGIVGREGWSPWVLHMGVRLPTGPDSAPGEEGPLRVVTAARFVEKKGHAHLLEAVSLLRERGVGVHVDLAGDGPLEAEIRGRVAALDLEDSVDLLGRVSHDELLADLVRGRWHVMVLPSVLTSSGELEGIPVSLVEAMACGVAVVGTDAGGVPELIAGEAGLLVSPADPRALADAVATLTDAAARASLAERGRARVQEDFSVKRIAAALKQRFQECAEKRNENPRLS